MGYTHYWYSKPEFDRRRFAGIVADFKKLIKPLEHVGVKLAGGLGTGEPLVCGDEIWFNGVEKCGHDLRKLGITWPGHGAGGVNTTANVVAGQWFAGTQLSTRTCGGMCSHETFVLRPAYGLSNFDRVLARRYNRIRPWHFECTKTAYKPYDLAVTACLIVADHHLGGSIRVSSDGGQRDWMDALMLCRHFLGYGRIPVCQTGDYP